MHYPKTDNGKTELKNKIATVHAQAVEQYLNQLSCPKEQKSNLLKKIFENT